MRTVTRNGTTYQQNTANIGKRKPEQPNDTGTRRMRCRYQAAAGNWLGEGGDGVK